MTIAIPRRLSVRDYGYDPALGQAIEVLVSGRRVTRVIAYDIDAGTVLRYDTTPDGDLIVNRRDGEAATETLTGTVEVRRRTD